MAAETKDQANKWLDWFLGAPADHPHRRHRLDPPRGRPTAHQPRHRAHRRRHAADRAPGHEGPQGADRDVHGERAAPRQPARDGPARPARRTIGSVLRSTANILVGATIVLMVLTELG
ncbi:hypothetical protein NKG05_01800 [Oerskovia sp. M15]